jgi:hypothetical protein
MMIDVTVEVALPYHLVLTSGRYGEIEVTNEDPNTLATRVTLTFNTDGEGLPSEQERWAEELLAATNRLLRWYRFLDHSPAVTEVAMEELEGPFQFRDEQGRPWGLSDGTYTRWAQPQDQPPLLHSEEISTKVQAVLAAGKTLDVWHILVVDAELALAEGRYREAVLFCWSAIESCLGKRFNEAAKRLDGLNSTERESVTGHNIDLVNRMTAGFHLVTGESLHTALGSEGWAKRRVSYKARNEIIHKGSEATREQAEQSIDFARQLIKAVEGLTSPKEQMA